MWKRGAKIDGMKKLSYATKKWWFWVIAIPVLLYIALVIYRIPAVAEQNRTAAAIERIQSAKLTMAHVDGKHLPPRPDPAQTDATIEGIDANANGIRDDVERAIFDAYPDDIKVRAAMLQYAMALQLYLTEVFNEETWIASVKKTGRGYGCIRENSKSVAIASARQEEVDETVINSGARKERYQDNDAHQTTYSVQSGEDCDV